MVHAERSSFLIAALHPYGNVTRSTYNRLVHEHPKHSGASKKAIAFVFSEPILTKMPLDFEAIHAAS